MFLLVSSLEERGRTPKARAVIAKAKHAQQLLKMGYRVTLEVPV